MKKTDNRMYNRRTKRLLGIEMDYFCAYNGQETPLGRVSDVKYVGNTVYGKVYVEVLGNWYVIVTEKFKPNLKSINEYALAPVPEPSFSII